jgi:hypothetical protein
MADDAPETPAAKRIKISPDRLTIAIENDFADDPDQVVQSFTWVNSRGMSGYRNAEQVADWTDG